jgi:hypothetical protein
MPELPKRLPYEALVIAAIALGSCDMPQAYRASDADKLNAASANARNAVARIPEIIDRLDRIEQRLDMQ